MKKNFNIFTSLFIALLLGNGCNDWLDVKPRLQMENDDMFSTEKGFKDALTGCYIKLAGEALYGTNMTMTFTEYLAQFWDFSSGNGRDEATLKAFDYKTAYAEGKIQGIYAAFYEVIAHANGVLENLRKHGHVIESEDTRKIIEAEALAIRAFCHTDVLRLFGQVPQNSTIPVQLPYATTVSVQTVPYYSYDRFISLILKDIEKAQELLQESDPVLQYTFEELDNFMNRKDSAIGLKDSFLGFRRMRFNYWALEGLKARLYLYMGDKNSARVAAGNVINAKTKNGKTMISLSGLSDLQKDKLYLTCPSESVLALNNNHLADYREALFSSTSGHLTEAHYLDLYEGQSLDINNRPKKIWKKTETAIAGMFYYDFQKYNQPASEENQFTTHFNLVPLIRLSEMYLIAMETASTLQEANSLYKTYMEDRGVIASDLSQSQLEDEILKEYRREFFGEGQMFFTYKRLGAKRMLWKSDREVGEKDYILPLPKTELGTK